MLLQSGFFERRGCSARQLCQPGEELGIRRDDSLGWRNDALKHHSELDVQRPGVSLFGPSAELGPELQVRPSLVSHASGRLCWQRVLECGQQLHGFSVKRVRHRPAVRLQKEVADVFSELTFHSPHGGRGTQQRRSSQKIQSGRIHPVGNPWVNRVVKTDRAGQTSRRQQTETLGLFREFGILRRRQQLIADTWQRQSSLQSLLDFGNLTIHHGTVQAVGSKNGSCRLEILPNRPIFRSGEERVEGVRQLFPQRQQFRVAIHERCQGDGQSGLPLIRETERDAGIPLARGEVIAQFGRLGVKALGAELERRQAEADGHLNRRRTHPQSIHDAFFLRRERLAVLLVLQSQANSSKQHQVIGSRSGFSAAGGGPKLTRETKQSATLNLLQFLHAFFQQHVVGMPGGIRCDECRQGTPHGILRRWFFGLRALDIRFKDLLECGVGDHKAVSAEKFSGCLRALKVLDALDAAKIIGSTPDKHWQETQANACCEKGRHKMFHHDSLTFQFLQIKETVLAEVE